MLGDYSWFLRQENAILHKKKMWKGDTTNLYNVIYFGDSERYYYINEVFKQEKIKVYKCNTLSVFLDSISGFVD